jgi:hypothetical protein
VLQDAAKTDKTGWFKRTGWLEHLEGRNLVHLAHQARLTDQGEVKLKLVAQLTERLVERSVKGLSTLAQEARRWLRSAQQHEVDSGTGVCDEGGGAVEAAPNDAVHGMAEQQRGRGRSIPTEDGGSDGQRQLSAVLG